MSSFKTFFLSLSIIDKEFNRIINDISLRYNNCKTTFFPHISIRCTDNPLSVEDQIKLSELKFSNIEIRSVEVFEGDGSAGSLSHCVLKVDCPEFYQFWDKPDFPVDKYGYNAHITIYSGSLKIARLIQEELNNFKYTIKPEFVEILQEINTKTSIERKEKEYGTNLEYQL